MCCTRLAENTGRKKVVKNRHLGTIAQLCRAISSQLRRVSTIGKSLLSSNISSTCSHNTVNFGPLAAEIEAPLQISTGFASWQRYCTASSSGRQPNFAALNRGRHLCSAGRPLRWAMAHISISLLNDGLLANRTNCFILRATESKPPLSCPGCGSWMHPVNADRSRERPQTPLPHWDAYLLQKQRQGCISIQRQ